MEIEITVRSKHHRPSQHKLTPAMAGGIDYKETFTCSHTRKHADLFMKMLDISGVACGMESGEFETDKEWLKHWKNVEALIEFVHKRIPPELRE
jgi:hypothetical protein